MGNNEKRNSEDMDPQVATQFVGVLAQICATIFAVYLAAMLYVFQQKDLLRITKQTTLLMITFLTGCALYTVTLLYALLSLIVIEPSSSFPDSTAISLLSGFSLSLFFSLTSILVLFRTSTKD